MKKEERLTLHLKSSFKFKAKEFPQERAWQEGKGMAVCAERECVCLRLKSLTEETRAGAGKSALGKGITEKKGWHGALVRAHGALLSYQAEKASRLGMPCTLAGPAAPV